MSYTSTRSIQRVYSARPTLCSWARGGLTLFPGTPLLDEAQAGEFDPLREREMLEELLLFVENLTCDCSFITHHTIGGTNLPGPNFLERKDAIIAALTDEIENGNMDRMARMRAMKVSL